MALPARQQVTYWGATAAVFSLALWGLGDVILPFIVGGAIAYFMDPLADRLERLGLSRAASTSTIALVATLIFVILALAVVPAMIRQLTQLVGIAPEVARRLQSFLTTTFPSLMEEGSVINETLASLGQAVKARGGELATGVLSSAMGVVNFVVFIVVVPVVAFYMLLDWDNMVAKIDSWLPLDHAPTVRKLAHEIDKVLSGFVRGQISVCLILGAFYSISLMLAGLNFGLIAGAIAGGLTFIPYVGALVGGVLAIGLALFQFWGDWMSIGIVAAIFAAGQFLEGNLITPKLVGSSVGLHPLWLIFALSAFGTLFGFVGMLVAVPVAAMIGVVTRFVLERYLEGRLYKGLASGQEAAPVTALAHEPAED
ncbi:AI-2E family transporter [Sedimentimonas flavescens]|uniref:AI-2E family transporter n=1 Tax=Sedimentimonas flavescens TaxID=2851012 RepID=A0ABT2ZWC0_9RHOB|nr:AI-2E family transporter [Sedimentimonas flavescens]MBW0157436.1 AI-2E family transporter [Sedimentimonas flavescens]MCT2538706.1 AI-2E family transporter [Sedimentimonas flavescens]MCV2877907.1 AI-2E family transporter [Sedimentimonas flavescens]WBL34250.1 AI-2E family transporter [Sinirhodobacter sp. HNIBRBA609]